jgi:MFS family permease
MPVSGRLSDRYGSRTATIVLLLLSALALVLTGNTGNFYELSASLAFLGFSVGSMDIAMNAQCVAVQRQLNKPIMSRLHAMWSVGGMSGAAVGALAAKLTVLPSLHFLYVAVFLIVLAVLSRGYMLSKSVELSQRSEESLIASGDQQGNEKPVTKAILLYSAICFFGFMCEGAIADWSALYLGKSLNTDAGFAALGYAAFSMAMALGRFAGDHLIGLAGRNNLLRYGSLLNALVITIVLLLKSPWLALCGFVLVGFGLCTLAPIVYGTVSDLSRNRVAATLANVAFAGYFGILIGPALLGVAAQHFGFTAPLAIVAALSLLVFILATASAGAGLDSGEAIHLEQPSQSAT